MKNTIVHTITLFLPSIIFKTYKFNSYLNNPEL